MRVRVVTDAGVDEVAPEALGGQVGASEGLVWADLDHSEAAGMALLPRLFAVRAADVEDCHVRGPVPKLHLYPDHHYTSINGLARGVDGRLYFQPLKIFQNPHLVITVLGPTSTALRGDAARRELGAVHRRLDDGFRPRTSLELITAIRREMMSTLEHLVGDAATRIGEVERRITHSDPVRSERLLDELFALRHDLQTIRTSAAQAYQSYGNLLETKADDDSLAVDVRRVSELRQGFGHLVQTTDLEREYLQEMIDLFQTRVATELNRFVRRVTAWGTIGIAWTVIVGVYGMNLPLPGADSAWALAGVVAAMAVVAGLLAAFFRRHGWL